MARRRVEFTLSMPGVNTWNSRWSGEGLSFTVVRAVPEKKARELDGKQFTHPWPDGWCAAVIARLMDVGERAKKSRGFMGYDWMVTDVVNLGRIRQYGKDENPAT